MECFREGSIMIFHAPSRRTNMKLEYDFINPPSSAVRELPPFIFLHALGDCRRTWKKTAAVTASKTGRKPEKVDMLVVEDMTPRNVPSGKSTVAPIVVEGAIQYLNSFPKETDLESAKKIIVEFIMSVATERFVDAEKIRKHYDLDMMPLEKVGDVFVPEVNLESVIQMLANNSLVQNLPESGAKFHGDALFLYGTRAFFHMAKDPTIKMLFPKAVLKQIEGAGHFLHLDSPVEFIDAVSEFILDHTDTNPLVHRSKY